MRLYRPSNRLHRPSDLRTPLAALVLVAFAGSAPAQTASLAMGNNPSGQSAATMTMGSNGMSINASAGSHSMSITLGDMPASPPSGGGGNSGGGGSGSSGSGGGSTSSSSVAQASAAPSGAVSSSGGADFERCNARANRLADRVERRREMRRCRRMR